MSQVHTYNLKLLILNNDGQIVKDDVLYENIKNELVKNTTHTFRTSVNGTQESADVTYTIKWEYYPMNGIEKEFMGDFLTVPEKEFDMIMVEHTNITISDIEKNVFLNPQGNSVAFYISKLLATGSNV